MTLSCKWPFNTKNERNNASSLPNWISHFLLPLVFPHVSAYKSNLPVHTYPTHIPIISITQDSSGSIWNWACVEVAILNTIFTVQLGFSVHTIPAWLIVYSKISILESGLKKLRIRMPDSPDTCGWKSNPRRKNSAGFTNIRIYVWTGPESHTSRTRTPLRKGWYTTRQLFFTIANLGLFIINPFYFDFIYLLTRINIYDSWTRVIFRSMNVLVFECSTWT